MDIMIDNGQIWCKLSALVMICIHLRTPTFHLEWVFNPPPPYGGIQFEQHLCYAGSSLRLPHGMNVNAGMKTWGALATLPILLRGLCLHTSIGEIKYTPMQLAASLS